MKATTATALSAPELLAELVAEAIGDKVGSLGVLVRDVPPPDPKHLLERLDSMRREQGIDMRVAYLRSGGAGSAKKLSLGPQPGSGSRCKPESWTKNHRFGDRIVAL